MVCVVVSPLLITGSMVVLALAVAPSTGRWIQAAQRRPAYPQANYQRY